MTQPQSDVKAMQRNRHIEGAKRYARANASDPFAFNRCMAHINQGIVGFNEQGEEAIYSAEEALEERPSPMGDGTTYTVTVFRNIKRP
jgi:hypothetical protein